MPEAPLTPERPSPPRDARELAFARLDVDETRRRAGVPSLTTIVAETTLAAYGVVATWAERRGIALVEVPPAVPLDAFVRERLLARPELRERLLTGLAARLGTTRDGARNAYRGRGFAALAPSGSTPISAGYAALVERLLGAPPVGTPAYPLQATDDETLAAALALLDADRLPTYVVRSEDAEMDDRTVEAATLVERHPVLRITLACDTTTHTAITRNVGRSKTHLGDLFAEGRIVVADGAPNDPAVAAAVLHARALRDRLLVTRADDARGRESARDAARSAAEYALYIALERHEATKGRFRLNGVVVAEFHHGSAEVDLVDPLGRIAIEVDGYHHFTNAEAYRRDRRKDAALQVAGFLVLRTLADDVTDRIGDVVSQIVETVHRYRAGDASRAT